MLDDSLFTESYGKTHKLSHNPCGLCPLGSSVQKRHSFSPILPCLARALSSRLVAGESRPLVPLDSKVGLSVGRLSAYARTYIWYSCIVPHAGVRMRRSLVARRGLRLRHLSLLRAGRAIAPAVAYQQPLPLTNHPTTTIWRHPILLYNISEFRNQGLLAVLGGADTFSNEVTLGDTGWLLLGKPGATRSYTQHAALRVPLSSLSPRAGATLH